MTGGTRKQFLFAVSGLSRKEACLTPPSPLAAPLRIGKVRNCHATTPSLPPPILVMACHGMLVIEVCTLELRPAPGKSIGSLDGHSHKVAVSMRDPISSRAVVCVRSNFIRKSSGKQRGGGGGGGGGPTADAIGLEGA